MIIWVVRPAKRSTRAASHGFPGSGVKPGGKVASIWAVSHGYAIPCWIRRSKVVEYGSSDTSAGIILAASCS